MPGYRDFGYNKFGSKSVLTSGRMSPLEAKNNIPKGALSAANLSSPLNPTTDIEFSSTDNDTAAWTSGTIYFADGSSSGEISSGDTGNITDTTFVYFDKTDTGQLKTTQDHRTASGPNKALLAIVDLGASGKDCKIVTTLGSGLTVSGLTASQIEANTITASEIAASTITGDEISANQLDALATSTGTLDVDEYMTLGSDANVKIDGNNKRIIINDGTNDRILIGYDSGGF